MFDEFFYRRRKNKPMLVVMLLFLLAGIALIGMGIRYLW
ncbi:hypothetical protein JOD01_001692 [Brevibacillus fulvus]|uniref:Uncharacterized protein n=1 Tax=Brevibacillus fulvus TaxID=1125967 RepID=A0A938Y146_9BACL|nr:hypothetical protein [Brevibacillus fulvus]